MTHCPACQTPLPDPPERFCPNCGYDLQAAGSPETPPPPPAAWIPPTVPPHGAAGSGWAPPRAGAGTPWERRAQIGIATALVETTQRVLLSPGQFFREMPVTGLGDALFYGVIVGYIGVMAKAVYDLVFSNVFGGAFDSLAQEPQLRPFLSLLHTAPGLAGFFWALVFGVPLLVVGMFISAGIFHLVLLLLGGANRGFEATFRVVAYAEAAQLVNVIPLCGGLVGALYMMVLCAIGLKEAHQTDMWKAVVAVLVPIVLVCCCCVGGIALFAGSLAALIGNAH